MPLSMMKSSIALLMSTVLLLSSFSFWLTPKEEKWVITIESPAIEYQSPSWFEPVALEDASEDIEDWVKLLPYEEDRNDDVYIVLPTLWLITPVVFVPEGSDDHSDMISGKEIDINKYLTEWVMHYASSWMPWDVGNPVIFGHSNYFSDKPWKKSYKSIFADIMNLDVWATDEMWVFTKEDNEYALRKFTIEESYETTPEDVWILKPKWGKELTVFACTNGLEWRWILRGKLIEDDEVLVPYSMRYRMYDIISQMETIQPWRRQGIVIEGMKMVEKIRETLPKKSKTFEEKMKKYILNYIERELVKVY